MKTKKNGQRAFNSHDYDKYDFPARQALWSYISGLGDNWTLLSMEEEFCEPDLKVTCGNMPINFEIEVRRCFDTYKKQLYHSDQDATITIPHRKFLNGTLRKTDYYIVMNESFSEAIIIPKRVFRNYTFNLTESDFGGRLKKPEQFMNIPMSELSYIDNHIKLK